MITCTTAGASENRAYTPTPSRRPTHIVRREPRLSSLAGRLRSRVRRECRRPGCAASVPPGTAVMSGEGSRSRSGPVLLVQGSGLHRRLRPLDPVQLQGRPVGLLVIEAVVGRENRVEVVLVHALAEPRPHRLGGVAVEGPGVLAG